MWNLKKKEIKEEMVCLYVIVQINCSNLELFNVKS